MRLLTWAIRVAVFLLLIAFAAKNVEPVPLRFDDLMTGNRFARGHRLRVVLTSSFHPHFSRNLHTGEDEAVSSRSRSAKLDVLFDSEHPSRLVLPVLEGARR